MKKVLFSITLISFAVMTLMPLALASRGGYIKGRTIYRKRLWRCSMLWRKFGDIHKSNGKRLARGTELYMELAKLSEREFHLWLADPMHHHPRVNCKAGPFYSKHEVALLRHYIYNKAFNPPKRSVIVRRPFKRSKIRLVKTQKLLRQRIETLKRIRKWLPDYTPSRPAPKKPTALSHR